MSEGFPSLTHERRAFPLPTISEDTLQYELHLPPTTESGPDSAADAAALATLITFQVGEMLPQPWIWNKDPWELKVVPSSSSSSNSSGTSGSAGTSSASASAGSASGSAAGVSTAQAPSKLEGRMRVGDAVDDEWLVVWLLRQISERHPSLAISIRDNDGEFLLIEAAHELPAWVSPENADNRFWLMGGGWYLIPLGVRSKAPPKQVADDSYDDSGRAVDPNAYLSEDDALRALREGQERYRAPEGVAAAIEERISRYPAALKSHQHRTRAYVPPAIAKALHADPSLIQKAVEAFYVRDPAQLRSASRMARFPPSEAVLASIPMTRTAYAQLAGQVWHPPRAFGPEWHVPESAGADEARWRDIGAKIATGFEIMYKEGGRARIGPGEAASDPSILASDPEYKRYLSDLQRAGFFGTELQGSARWQEREKQAAKGWVEARSSDSASRPSFAAQVDAALAKTEHLEPAAYTVNKVDADKEDDDGWLAVDPHELDALMAKAAGGSSSNQAKVGEEDGKALADLAKKMEAFVGGEGDLGGARFADELDDEDMDTSDSDSDEEQEQREPDPALTERQRQERLAALVQPLDASEWGRRTQQTTDIDMSDSTGPGLVAGSKAGDAMLPSSMRPPRFEKQEYDGVISESSDEDEEEDLGPENSIGRKVLGMRWGEGAPRPGQERDEAPKEATIEEIPSDEDEEDRQRKKALELGDIDEEMNRRVWGSSVPDADAEREKDRDAETDDENEHDVNMDDEENDFLEFTRKALGLDDQQWADILKERRDRGAYVPSPASRKASSAPIQPPPSAPAPPKKGEPNQALNSFETMMKAMEDELARHKRGGDEPMAEEPAAPRFVKPAKKDAPKSAPRTQKGQGGLRPGKGKSSRFQRLQDLPSEADLDNMDDEELAAMDAELKLALEGVSDDEDMPEVSQLDDDGKKQYDMMKNFLESYRSQAGQSGVVGNLFGRLGVQDAAKDKK